MNDARSLAKLSDITLFTVRQEMVSTSEVREAIDIFNKSGMRIDGLVFNGFVPSRIRYGYNYGYGYGGYFRYAKYGGRYGRYGKYSNYGDDKDKTPGKNRSGVSDSNDGSDQR